MPPQRAHSQRAAHRFQTRQLALPLPPRARKAPDETWRAGKKLPFLGGALSLRLDPWAPHAQREGEVLRIPLPPEASARQIRDAAESWLRAEALSLFTRLASAHDPTIEVVLAFGRHAPRLRRDGKRLRCHWRLIEAPLAEIERAIAHMLARERTPSVEPLFPHEE
ncbi:MAG: M48 family metallopeptidase [Rhodocyclaceae bacterium]|nr:M48 family metallopeptidase [Rhodocyclaceae bacterium]